MNDIFHKPIEKRKLLLLCNPGREEDRNYTPAVFNVLNRYKEYFMSPVGGGWISSDVEEYNEIIEEPAGYDDEGEQTWLYDQIRKICRHTDYSIIVFVGHGDSTHGDEIQLSKGKFIPVNSSSISMMTVLSIGLLIHGCQAMQYLTIRFSTIFWRRLLLM
jgi:hypothetical protein